MAPGDARRRPSRAISRAHWPWAALALAPVLASCVVSSATPMEDPRIRAVLVLQLDEDGALIYARVIEPYTAGAQVVLAQGGPRAAWVLSYDRPLADYGLEVQRGALVVESDARAVAGEGDPLPAPLVWRAVSSSVSGDVETLDAAGLAVALARVRVPRAPCPVATVVRELPVRNDTDIRFVLPLDAERLLVSTRLEREAAGRPARPGVVGWVERAPAVGGTAELRPLLSAGATALASPYMTRDEEGAAWVSVVRDGAEAGLWTCVFRPGELGMEHCTLDRFAETPPAKLQVERHAVRRVAGAYHRLILVHDRPDESLPGTWRAFDGVVGPDGSTEWRALDEVAIDGRQCNNDAAPYVTVARVEGEGRGLYSLPGKGLFRYARAGATVSRQALWPASERPLCRVAYAEHPLGGELLAESEGADSRLWWRAAAEDAWGELPERQNNLYVLQPLRGQVLASATRNGVAVVFRDVRRPELLPRLCPLANLGNRASNIYDEGDAILVAGDAVDDNQPESFFAWLQL